MRIGIEIEYWVVDGDGALAPADGVIAAADGVDRELVEPLLEVKTPPCESVSELVDALADRLVGVLDAARSLDRRIVPLGTPLSDERLPHRSSERSRVQRAVLGEDFRHAKNCAGTHLHFEQTAVEDQIAALTALDPAIALVNTAPYYRGRRTAACARPHAYRRLCYEGLPSHGRLWRYPESAGEWRRRVRERFDAFRSMAVDCGVDPETVAAAFSPQNGVWSPVCLRDDLGTVEWRAPDAAPPLDLCRLADDVSRVVAAAVDRGTRVGKTGGTGDAIPLPRFEHLRETVDRAIAKGATARVERHLSRIGLDPDAYRPIGESMDGRDRIDGETARALRLEAADRFERDVRRLGESGYDPRRIPRG